MPWSILLKGPVGAAPIVEDIEDAAWRQMLPTRGFQIHLGEVDASQEIKWSIWSGGPCGGGTEQRHPEKMRARLCG
jgi:hypothetical protein